MKNLLFLIGSLGSGGAERQMTTIACLLKSKGYNVSFLCYHQDDFYRHLLDENGIKVETVKYKSAIGKFCQLWKSVGKKRPDVVISMLSSPNFYALLTGIGRKHKIITGLRGVPDLPNGNYGKDAKMSWRAKFIVSNSNNAKDVWLETYPKHKAKFRVIYNTVTLGEIDSKYIPRRDGKLHIIVAASCYEVKNPMGVAKALALMTPEERSKIVIEWYGKKEYQNNNEVKKVEQYISDNGLQNSFILFPPTSDIANKMNSADIVGLFSLNEGLPNAICEGMSIGKPIIMTKVSDYAQLVDASNGILCETKEPGSIKDALLRLIHLSDSELRRMGQKSFVRSQNLFSPENVLNRWIEIIEN